MTPISLPPPQLAAATALSPAKAEAPSAAPGPAPARSFAEVLRAPPAEGAAPPAAAPNVVRSVLQNVAAGHREMDRIIKMAQSGRSFSSAQLIGLQARVFRLSTEIDLASKLLEKVTSGVKQAMSTQV